MPFCGKLWKQVEGSETITSGKENLWSMFEGDKEATSCRKGSDSGQELRTLDVSLKELAIQLRDGLSPLHLQITASLSIGYGCRMSTQIEGF